MADDLVLASKSGTRARLLANAGVSFRVVPSRLDEATIKESALAEGVSHRDLADILADAKAQKAATQERCLVLGCDQVLSFDGEVLDKPKTRDEAYTQLLRMRGGSHRLFTAAVIYEGGRPVWRYVGSVKLWMRATPDTALRAYVDEYWESIRHSVGCYRIEEEGVRLFSRIEGDFFHILGLPVIELLSYLNERGTLHQ